MSGSSDFLKAAQQGQNQGWRYALSVLLILFGWLVVGSIPLILWGGDLLNDGNSASTSQAISLQAISLRQYVLLNLGFIPFLVAIALAVHFIHKRSPRTLVAPSGSISRWRILQGAAVWLGLISLYYVIEAFVAPSHFELSFQMQQWWAAVPIVLLLTPLQTSAEELFFRGYIMQGLGLLTQRRLLVVLLSAWIFGALHLANPEVAASSSAIGMALLYFAFGVLPALVTLQDNSLELALGWHAANNLFLALIVRDQVSVLTTPALFTRTIAPNPWQELAVFIVQSLLFIALFRWVWPTHTNLI